MEKVLFLIALLSVGCTENVQTQGCETPYLPDQLGNIHQPTPEYVEMFGCETFVDMETTADFGTFCVNAGLSTFDSDYASDTIPGCRPDSEGSACERFWICE